MLAREIGNGVIGDTRDAPSGGLNAKPPYQKAVDLILTPCPAHRRQVVTMFKSGNVLGLPIVNARDVGIDIGSCIQVTAGPSELTTRFTIFSASLRYQVGDQFAVPLRYHHRFNGVNVDILDN